VGCVKLLYTRQVSPCFTRCFGKTTTPFWYSARLSLTSL